MSMSECDLNGIQDETIYTASSEQHCMKDTLYNYVLPKIHPEIRKLPLNSSKDYTIVIRGLYDRSGTSQINENEKNDKPFNWHRPTLSRIDSQTLALNCFSGRDYVRHYASLVATYLSLKNRTDGTVQLQPPDKAACQDIFLKSNLRDIGAVDIVIIGYVWQLENLVVSPSGWQGKEDDMFSWRKSQTSAGQTVALLGCRPSFWADISGHLIDCLHELNNTKCIIYVGKAGSLKEGDSPNHVIGTGNSSYLGKEELTWTNVLQEYIHLSSKVQEGHHVTIPTPLCQSMGWVEEWESKARWVDCEVGHIVAACKRNSMSFGYLHIITDNMTNPYPFNLSNERLSVVKTDRRALLDEVERILKAFLAKGIS